MHSVEVTTSFCTEGATPAEHLWEGMVSAGADAYKQPRALGLDATLRWTNRRRSQKWVMRRCVAPLLDSTLAGRPRYRQPQDNRLRGS